MPARVCFLSVGVAFTLATTLLGGPLEEELLSREREFINAIKQEDQAVMKEMLADGATSVVPGRGRQSKEQILNRLADTNLKRYEIDDVKAVRAGDHVGILSYRYSWSGSPGDKGEQVGTFYATSTWVRSEGVWKVIFYQQTSFSE